MQLKPLNDNQHLTSMDLDSFECQVKQSSIESLKELLYDANHMARDGDRWAKSTADFVKAELKRRGVAT